MHKLFVGMKKNNLATRDEMVSFCVGLLFCAFLKQTNHGFYLGSSKVAAVCAEPHRAAD